MGWVAKIAAVTVFALGAFSLSMKGVEAQEASARENVMKTCGDKWRTVRDAEKTKGVTWPQFLSSCREQISAASGPPASSGANKEAAAGARKDVPAKPARQAAIAGAGPIFPQDVAARHASERPSLARQRTCAEQFKSNKSLDANGGLKWIEKGGGYWSRCNAHLKQARA